MRATAALLPSFLLSPLSVCSPSSTAVLQSLHARYDGQESRLNALAPSAAA